MIVHHSLCNIFFQLLFSDHCIHEISTKGLLSVEAVCDTVVLIVKGKNMKNSDL